MIKNFEDFTAELTDYEKNDIVPALVERLKVRVGSRQAIRNKELCHILTANGLKGLSEARVRKCINYIRHEGLVENLIANSHGYFVATSIQQVEDYRVSLRQRASAIMAIDEALGRGIAGRLFI